MTIFSFLTYSKIFLSHHGQDFLQPMIYYPLMVIYNELENDRMFFDCYDTFLHNN